MAMSFVSSEPDPLSCWLLRCTGSEPIRDDIYAPRRLSPSPLLFLTATDDRPWRRWPALLLAGFTALLLSGCGPDKPVANTPTTQLAAQQEAGAPSSVVQANARQYRMPRRWRWSSPAPWCPRQTGRAGLGSARGASRCRGVDLADDGRTLYFPNVQPDKSYEVSLKAGWAHPPELDPQDPSAGGGHPYRQRHGIAAA